MDIVKVGFIFMFSGLILSCTSGSPPKFSLDHYSEADNLGSAVTSLKSGGDGPPLVERAIDTVHGHIRGPVFPVEDNVE